MNNRIFRRDSGRAEVAPRGNTNDGRGSAETSSFSGRDSSALPGTARSAAALSRLSAAVRLAFDIALEASSLFFAPIAFARKLFGLERDDFSFSIGSKRGHHPQCETCEDV